MKALNQCYEAILQHHNNKTKSNGLFSNLFSLKTKLIKSNNSLPKIKGIYLYGGVGRGKTLIMDIFYTCFPDGIGERIHYHEFMRSIHQQMNELKEYSDPLNVIAKRMSNKLHLLCLDEFHVIDITGRDDYV